MVGAAKHESFFALMCMQPHEIRLYLDTLGAKRFRCNPTYSMHYSPLFVTLCVAVLAAHLHGITMAIHTADTSRIPLISQGNTPRRNVAFAPQYRASECLNLL